MAGITEFGRFRADAMELLAETGRSLPFRREGVVFLLHQGYTFVYLPAPGGFDRPPMWTGREARQVAPTFVDMVDAESRLTASR